MVGPAVADVRFLPLAHGGRSIAAQLGAERAQAFEEMGGAGLKPNGRWVNATGEGKALLRSQRLLATVGYAK